MELDNLSRIKQDDKWIFCDERGNNVLNQGFYYIDSFINRKARLRRGTRRWNIINSDGSFFFKNDARQISPESDGFFAVLFKNRKSNYLKVSDWSFLLKENCEMCFSFREGMGRIFDSDGSTNYVNVYGEKILKNGCYFGKDFSEGYAAVILEKGNGWNLIDKEGKTLFERNYETLLGFSEGYSGVKISEGQWNFVDKEGNFLLDEHVAKLENFRDGVCAIQRADGHWTFLDKNKNPITSESFLGASEFKNGLALVKRNGGKWNYLKTDGTLLSELDFDSKPHMRAKDWIRVDIDGKTQYITTRYGTLSDSLSETYEELKIARMRDALSIWLSSSQT